MGPRNFAVRTGSVVSALIVITSILLGTGCELTSVNTDSTVVAGVDVDALFAQPTEAERQEILLDWSDRDVSARNVTIEKDIQFNLAGRTTRLRVVGHDVPEGSGFIRHYGAVITPPGLQLDSAPVIVFAHGSDRGVEIDGDFETLFSTFRAISDQFVYVVPSYRSETIGFGDEEWTSEGAPSPWDRDVDDALALLSVAGEIEPSADMSNVAVLGLSRGMTVGMIMDIRDDRIGGVIGFFGPTDFFGPFAREVTIDALEGMPRDLPGLDVLNERFLTPLGNGDLPIQVVRLELLRRSPIHFVNRLGRIQIHHGRADDLVPVSESERFIRAAEDANLAGFEPYIYDDGDHNPFFLPMSLDRAQEYLQGMLDR
ncbi:MAG: peptidase [Rhodothermales bacterium]|nr:peptidase [Rhodothermales bacterium]